MIYLELNCRSHQAVLTRPFSPGRSHQARPHRRTGA